MISRYSLILRLAAALCQIVLVTGCASSLHVYDSYAKPMKGVPFRLSEAYVKTGIHNKSSAGGVCDPTPFVSNATLATGPLYYAEVVPAQLAKTQFNMKYGETGALSEISLGTEPASETISAATDLLKTIGVGATPAAAAAAAPSPAKACDAGEQNVRFVRLDEYMQGAR